jgi:C1A family cysteine protease
MPEDFSKRKLGVRGPSPRGIFPTFGIAEPLRLPDEYSYEYDFGPIFNQGDESDCEPHAIAGIETLYFHKRTGKWYDFSRAAIYVQGKLDYEGGDFDVEGMYPATGLQLVQARGNVMESAYPTTDYNVEKRTAVAAQLWQAEFKIVTFTEVNTDPESVKTGIVHAGPLAMAVNFPNSWFTPDKNGVVPEPDFSAGGHYIIGGAYSTFRSYLPKGGGIKCRNSWGKYYGLDGWMWIPFEYLEAQAMNFYTVSVK